MLLGGGADPNQETSRGTPLSAAAHEGEISMLTLLLDAGAEINHISHSGEQAASE